MLTIPALGPPNWRSSLAAAAAVAAIALPSVADPTRCDGTAVWVDAPTEALTATVCETAASALVALQSCNLSVDRPLEISIVESMPNNCFGQYHCGEGRIDVLTPEGLQAVMQPDSTFRPLPANVFFESVVVHEIAHAATDDLPCPFDNCLVGQEYISYAMQYRSIPADLRGHIIEDRFRRPISRDELVVMILFMAPDLFGQKAYMHFTQREDPCGFIGQIASGTVLLDMERF